MILYYTTQAHSFSTTTTTYTGDTVREQPLYSVTFTHTHKHNTHVTRNCSNATQNRIKKKQISNPKKNNEKDKFKNSPCLTTTTHSNGRSQQHKPQRHRRHKYQKNKKQFDSIAVRTMWAYTHSIQQLVYLNSFFFFDFSIFYSVPFEYKTLRFDWIVRWRHIARRTLVSTSGHRHALYKNPFIHSFIHRHHHHHHHRGHGRGYVENIVNGPLLFVRNDLNVY